MNKYFFTRNGDEIQGPFEAVLLEKHLKSGLFPESTLVSADKENWVPILKALYLEEPEKKEEEPTLTVCTMPPEPPPEPAPSKPDFPEEKPFVPNTKPQEPETVSEVMGNTLQMIWNTPDKLEDMARSSVEHILKVMLPTSVVFTLFIVAADAFSIAYFHGGLCKKLIFFSVYALLVMLIQAGEILLVQSMSTDRGAAGFKHAVILTGMAIINFAAVLCVGALTFSLSMMTGQNKIPAWTMWAAGPFFLFICCFFFANMAAGIRIGFADFFGWRPRRAIWFSAFLLWQFFMLLYAGYALAKYTNII